VSSAIKLIAATEFSLEELAEAYNETRIDYIIPMPMTVERLREYIRLYDVDLTCSCAAVLGTNILGIGMLGVRDGRGWVTRLGVLPSGRRQGVGNRLMSFLLNAAREHELPEVWLEVIEGNNPAYKLFRSLDFQETRELIVARRPPSFREMAPGERSARRGHRNVRTLDLEATLRLLRHRKDNPNWLNQNESLTKVAELSALFLETSDGGQGWVTFRTSLLRLTRIVVNVVEGAPEEVTAALLHMLHDFFPTQDAIAENIPALSPIWPGFEQAGYFEAFRRVEMVKRLI
jgi:ribosomal protein S18 acetylase RimI-like enzyme